MKKSVIIFLIFLAYGPVTNAQTTASVMSVSGKDINDVLNSTQDGVILLKFVSDKTNLKVEAFAYSRNTANHFKKIPLKALSTTTTPAVPLVPLTAPIYIVTLKWKYDESQSEDFEDDSTYYLIPQQIKKYIVYTFSATPQPDLPPDFVNEPDEVKKKIMYDIYVKADKAGKAFNPIPPKLVP